MKLLMIGNSSKHWGDFCTAVESEKQQIVKIESCKDGYEALQNDEDFDGIIIYSAGVNNCGLEFLAKVKGDLKLKGVPVILVGTGFSEELVSQYYSLGVFDLILMPASRNTILAKLSRMKKDGRKTVLVVDDEKAIVEFLTVFLKRERYKAVGAYSSEEALELIKTNNIDAVISDYLMPGMSGLDLLVELKNKFPGIPVILITGHSGKFGPIDAIQAGADGYFAKPFNNVELIYVLRHIIEKYRRN